MLKNLREKLIKSGWLEKLEKIFFSLFILSIPLQTRLTFLTGQTYLNGRFNEYATFFIYLSDIFLIITLFLYFVNRLFSSLYLNFVMSLSYSIKKLFTPEKNDINYTQNNDLTKRTIISIIKHKLSTSPQLIPIILLFTIVLWSFLGIYWAKYQDIALFRSLKLLELSLFFVYLNERFYWFGRTRLLFLFFIAGFTQSIVGIFQYYYQHSLGLKLLGESLISPNTDNVAKIVVDGDRIIRAYGTFPHPNIFAAFLILSIYSGFWLLLSHKSVRRSIIVSRETISARASEGETVANGLNMNKSDDEKSKSIIFKLFHVKQFDRYVDILLLIFLTIGIILQLYALTVTFSRLAWIGIVMAPMLIIFLNLDKVLHSYPSQFSQFKRLLSQSISTKLFHVKHFQPERWWGKQLFNINLNKLQKISLITIVLCAAAIFGSYWNVVVNRLTDLDRVYEQSMNNRILYKNIALNIINSNFLLGVGNGNFTLVTAKYTEKSLEWWQHQPVHNIYLLIASELGVFGFIIFMLFMISILNKFLIQDQDAKIISRFPRTASISINITRCNENNKIVSRETILLKYLIASIFVVFLFMGLYDHYFWSFQQGQLSFWLIAGVLSSLSYSK